MSELVLVAPVAFTFGVVVGLGLSSRYLIVRRSSLYFLQRRQKDETND